MEDDAVPFVQRLTKRAMHILGAMLGGRRIGYMQVVYRPPGEAYHYKKMLTCHSDLPQKVMLKLSELYSTILYTRVLYCTILEKKGRVGQITKLVQQTTYHPLWFQVHVGYHR